jgi:type I restriction enzyme M protein
VEYVSREFNLPATSEKQRQFNVAKTGDILIGRVGRNFQEKVCRVEAGTVAVSDCIFILRVTPEHRDAVFSYLKSKHGRQALICSSHGVGAKFLTTDALQNILFKSK